MNGSFPLQPRMSWSHSVTLPITITITTTADDHFRAETPGGPVEASSLRELGDRLRDFLANLEDESASDPVELAQPAACAMRRHSAGPVGLAAEPAVGPEGPTRASIEDGRSATMSHPIAL